MKKARFDSAETLGRTYKKRRDANAMVGFLYEIRICMLLILRCVAQGIGFELKCNVEDEEKLFDDVVCKITSESGPHKVRHLFLQAKHNTSESASIFKAKNRKHGKCHSPIPLITEWFKSFQTLSKQHPDEYFEMVFYTTKDIDQDLKLYFAETTSKFSDLISCNPTHGNVYSLKPEFVQKCAVEIPVSDIQQFCCTLKFVVSQSNESDIEKQIQTELPQESEPEKNLTYNEACSFMENWHKSREEATVITWDIFAEAAQKTDRLLLRNILKYEKNDTDFTFNDETISELKKILGRGENITILSVDSVEIHTDLVKQYLRELDQTQINFFSFTFAELLSLPDMAIINLECNRNLTFLLINIDEEQLAGNKEKFAKDFEEILSKLSEFSQMHAIFLIRASATSNCTQRCQESQFETFSSLDNATKKYVLSYSIEFMGEICSIGEMEPEKLVNGKLIADIRAKSPIRIGEALSQGNFNSETYISRSLQIHQKVNEEQILGRRDKYIIMQEENTVCEESVYQQGTSSLTRKSEGCTVCTKSEASEIFCAVCEEKPQKGVHLLERSKGQLLWVKTGNHESALEKLDRLIDEKTSSTCTEDELIEKHILNPISSKVVLVSSNPGMGKSLFANSLSRNLVGRKVWPVLVSLNQCNKLLETLQNSGKRIDESPVQVLERFIEKAHHEMFHTFLADPNKVVVLLDGFDEIAPKYTELVLSLINLLCKTNVKSIVVLTRPHLAQKIQKETFALLVHLLEFNETDIESYLKKHYTHCISRQQVESERLKQFISALSDFIFSDSRSYWKEVTGVPQQTYMVAEVFRASCEQYLANKSVDTDLSCLPSEKDKDIDFYETIVKQKIELTLKEKYTIAEHHTDEIVAMFSDQVYKNHIRCGLALIFKETSVYDHFNTKLDKILEKPDEVTRYGIVTMLSKEYIDFIHRSFAEYFCAVRIVDIMLSSSESTALKEFIYNSVLVVDQYKLIRKFIDIRFLKQKKSLCFGSSTSASPNFLESVFKHTGGESTRIVDITSTSARHSHTGAKDSSGVLLVAAEEGNSHITRRILGLCHQVGGATVVQRLLTVRQIGRYEHTPLHLAAVRGHTETVRELLGAGADLSVTDEEGESPLHRAAGGGHPSTVSALLDLGVNIDLPNVLQRTALHEAAGGGHDAVVELLLDKGAYTEARDGDGQTPLHRAASGGRTSTVRLLARRGCQLSAKVKMGRTMQHLAARSGSVKTIQALVELGVGVCDWDNVGYTTLHYAAESGNVETIRLLVELGVSATERKNEHNTPLHCVGNTYSNDMDKAAAARVLLELGAELNARNQIGQTPLTLARNKYNWDIARFLESRGATE